MSLQNERRFTVNLLQVLPFIFGKFDGKIGLSDFLVLQEKLEFLKNNDFYYVYSQLLMDDIIKISKQYLIKIPVELLDIEKLPNFSQENEYTYKDCLKYYEIADLCIMSCDNVLDSILISIDT